MPICSLCNKQTEGSVYKFEQCSAHNFCCACFINENKMKKFDCSDCHKVFYKGFFPKFPSINLFSKKSCSYCKEKNEIITCENSHYICTNCLLGEEPQIDCYYCYVIFLTYCLTCKNYPRIKVPVFAHPRHSICYTCCKDKHIINECKECQNSTVPQKDGYCSLCCKVPIKSPPCNSHGFCINCLVLLNIYKDVIDCENYTRNLRQINIEQICTICGIENSNLIPILSCSYNHKICESCDRSLSHKLETPCQDCRFYFSRLKSMKKNCCIICYHSSSQIFEKLCKNHYICITCSQKLKPVWLMTQKLIKCSECKDSLNEKTKKPKDLKEDNCQACGMKKVLSHKKKCHKFCKDCLINNQKRISKFVEKCSYCTKFLENACRMCLKVTEQHSSIECKFLHIYCFSCSINGSNFNNNEVCRECRKIVLTPTTEQQRSCIKCSSRDNSLFICRLHSICSNCLINRNFTIYEIDWCPICMNYKPSVATQECREIILNTTTVQQRSCKICNSLDSSVFNCNLHPICSNCLIYGNFYAYEINRCPTCMNYKQLIIAKLSPSYTQQATPYTTQSMNVNTTDTYYNSVSDRPQTSELKKTRQKQCKGCKSPCKKLKCDHFYCLNCIQMNFFKNFNNFISAIYQGNINYLTSVKITVCCPKPYCNNRYCHPFGLFWDEAAVVLQGYFRDANDINNFLAHYEGFFEGIDYKFEICRYCKTLGGKAYQQNCLWCGR